MCPYVAAVHIKDGIKQYPWVASSVESDRPILATLWASIGVQNRRATLLRQKLSATCLLRPGMCNMLGIKHRSAKQCYSSNESDCEKHSNADASPNMTGSDYYKKSKLCLQPPGDMECRKAFFDSVAVGCIPVIFNYRLMTKKYPWFFTGDIEEATTFYVSHNTVLNNASFNLIDYLARIPQSIVRSKQLAIEKLADSLNYAIPPDSYARYLGFGGSARELDKSGVTWSPPVPDAVDVLLRNMFERVERYDFYVYLVMFTLL